MEVDELNILQTESPSIGWKVDETNGDDVGGKNHYRNKRKKLKRKFISNAKGFGKIGNFGRGTRLEGDDWNYYINIMDSIRCGHDTLEDKLIMADNVFEQTLTKEIYISSNQIACTVIENLLPFTNEENFERYQMVFADVFRPMCSNKFASHILQKLIEISFLRGISKLQETSAGAADADDAVDGTNNMDCDNGGFTKKAKIENPNRVFNEKEYNLKVAKFTEKHIETCQQFLMRISNFLLNNLESFVWDTYGSHLIRTCLLNLCGVYVEKRKDFIGGKSSSSVSDTTATTIESIKPLKVPIEYHAIINEYAQRLQAWPQFSEFPDNQLSSGVLQHLFIALHHTDKNNLKHLGNYIINNSFLMGDIKCEKDSLMPVNKVEINDDVDVDELKDDIKLEIPSPSISDDGEKKELPVSKLPNVFYHEQTVRLLETMILVAGRKLLTNIYIKLFYGNIKQISEMESANYTVQKLINKINEKEEFESIFDEAHPNIENLLRIGHTGVVIALASGCQRFQVKQGAFVQSLQLALHCQAPVERQRDFAMLLIQLKPYDMVYNNSNNSNSNNTTNAKSNTNGIEQKNVYVHLQGSILLQNMFKFQKPIKIIESLLNIPAQQLSQIICNPRGSHIVDGFFESATIGEKSRERFVKHLIGYYLELAMSKCGSRAFDTLFERANDNLRARILKELSPKANLLKSTLFGRIINTKYDIDTYRQSPSQWKMPLIGNTVKKSIVNITDKN